MWDLCLLDQLFTHTHSISKYTATKHPWLLAKSFLEHTFTTLLNVIRVWLMALRLFISSSCYAVFVRLLPRNL